MCYTWEQIQHPLCSLSAEAAGLLLSPPRGVEVLSMAAVLHSVSQTASAAHPPFKTGPQEASNCEVNIAYKRMERCWGGAGCCPRAVEREASAGMGW